MDNKLGGLRARLSRHRNEPTQVGRTPRVNTRLVGLLGALGLITGPLVVVATALATAPPASATGGYVAIDQSVMTTATALSISTSQANEVILVAANGWPCSSNPPAVTVDGVSASILTYAGNCADNTGGAAVFEYVAATAGSHAVTTSESGYEQPYFSNSAVSFLNATTSGITFSSSTGQTSATIVTPGSNELIFATATVNTGYPTTGTVTWTGTPVTPTSLGTNHAGGGVDFSIADLSAPTAGTYSVLPQDSLSYAAQYQAQIVVALPSAGITWSTPSPITYGTPISAAQLDAVPPAGELGTTAYTIGIASGAALTAGTVLAAGTYTLWASFTPSDPALSPSSASVQLQVNPAPLTITASSGASVYGSAPVAVMPVYQGFVNGNTAPAMPPACSTTATAGSAVGSYPTSCSGASDPNYSISYVAGTDTVTPAPLTITASSQSLTYGSAPAAVTPSYTGLVNGGLAPATPPTCSTAATSSSAAGSYKTTCSGAMDSNYSITYVDGTDTVNPAPLTITASSQSLTYGSSPAPVTASYQGLVNGGLAPATPPSCSTAVTATTAAGTYASTCSGAADLDYAITYAPGVVTVGAEAVTVIASSESSTYGSAPGAVTPTYVGLVNGDLAPATPAKCSSAATASSPVGTYDTTCSGASDPNYSFVYQSGTDTVTPAALTIAASSESSTYGLAPAAVTPIYTGLVNGDVAPKTPPTCSTTATGSSKVGSYPTSCSGAADSDYTITYVAGSDTIVPAPLTISASSGSSIYGSAPAAVTPQYQGLVNGDIAPVTAPTCSTTATQTSPVGTYPTTCKDAADLNYAMSYVAGTETVNPATLTITASSPTVLYGSAAVISPAYSGFVNSEAASVLTTAPTCSTTENASSLVGTYPSTCSGAVAPNYTIKYVAGTVTVKALPPTLAIVTPPNTASYVVGQTVLASYSCAAGAGGALASCVGTVPIGATIPTGSAGTYGFTVTATDTDGQHTTTTYYYNVYSPSSAKNATCSGVLPSGIYVNVTVQSFCKITVSDDILGNVGVQKGGQLLDVAAPIGGNLQATAASWVDVRGGNVVGNIALQNLTSVPSAITTGDGATANDICGTVINGNLMIQSIGTSSPVDVGAAPDCNTGVSVGVNLLVQNNASRIVIGSAGQPTTVKGNVEIDNNSGGGSITDVNAAGTCQLQNNSPGIVGSSNTALNGNGCNTVA